LNAAEVKSHRLRGLTRHWPILLLLAVGLAVGLQFGNDYGLSWDEHRNAVVGEEALHAYAGAGNYFSLRYIADHGPAYFMFLSGTSRLIHAVAPGWSVPDGRHLTNYAVFLVGVLFLYRLCLRFMAPRSAWMAAALFGTQPLLFGHGFVNQKDIPFMTLFLVVVVTGMEAADRLRMSTSLASGSHVEDSPEIAHSCSSRLSLEWQALNRRKKMMLLSAGGLALVLMVDLFLGGTLRRLGASTVAAAYAGEAPMLVQEAFSQVATDAHKTSLEAYLAIYASLFVNLRLGFTALVTFAGLAGIGKALPAIGDRLGVRRSAIVNAGWLTSAVVLGLTISTRQLGAFAGLLVTLYLLARAGTKGVFPILVYWAVACIATDASWPYLWPDPHGRFVNSVLHAAKFPVKTTLFRGLDVGSDSLPWDYFPTLTGLQLTEPAVLLVLLGCGVTIGRLGRRSLGASQIPILLAWVTVPVAALVSRAIPAYGIRHLLFVFPPLFVLAGIGMEFVLARLNRRWLQAVLVVLLLAPGIVGIAYMHPYEDAYFNSLVGGVSGAYGEYEVDRWCLSFREAVAVVNRLAPVDSTIGVPTQTDQIEPFLRSDLLLVSEIPEVEGADLVISCPYRTEGDWHTREFERVYAVRRGEAVFSEVWRRRQ